MNFHNQTNASVRRTHSFLAHAFTVTQYTWDATAGANAYADGDWTETQSTIEATIRVPETPRDVVDASGSDVVEDARIYVDAQSLDVETGTSDETRATEFTDSRTQKSYRAISVHDQGSLLEVSCEAL